MTVAGRGELTEAQWEQWEQWERLAPLLPLRKPPTGQPNKDHRTILDGILWKLRTGVPWRDLPERYGPWSTVASRYGRWRAGGLVGALR